MTISPEKIQRVQTQYGELLLKIAETLGDIVMLGDIEQLAIFNTHLLGMIAQASREISGTGARQN